MKKLLLGLCVLIIGACAIISTTLANHDRSWKVVLSKDAETYLSKQLNATPDDFYRVVIPQMEEIYKRWGIKFSATQGDSVIEFWIRADGDPARQGQAIYGSSQLTRANFNTGVFVNRCISSKATELNRDFYLTKLAVIGAHEIGHSYWLDHEEGPCYLMASSTQIGGCIEWVFSAKDIKHLDKVLK